MVDTRDLKSLGLKNGCVSSSLTPGTTVLDQKVRYAPKLYADFDIQIFYLDVLFLFQNRLAV